MKISKFFLVVPILVLTSACSSHYSAHGGYHSGYRHHGNVSVGVHGHGKAAGVLGALIVGGVIGHILTEEANSNNQQIDRPVQQKRSAEDELVNGYPMSQKTQQQAEKNEEQNRFYQLGQDGNCYLMEKVGDNTQIVSLVPNYSC